MYSEEEFDRLLRRALGEASLEDFSEVLADEAPVVHSFRYLRQRRAMLANPWSWCRKRTRPVWQKAARAVAAFALACLVGTAVARTVTPTAWAQIMGWARQFQETHTVYFVPDGQARREPLPQYQAGWLPEGYAEKSVFQQEGISIANAAYENEDGQQIVLSYQKKGTFIMSFEISEQEAAKVNGKPADFYQAKEAGWTNTLVWTDEETGLLFYIDADLEKEEMVHIAESLYLVNPTK